MHPAKYARPSWPSTELLFQYILDRLRDTNRASILLGRELLAFVEVLITDMQQEEETMLAAELLRDDVVGIEVETG